MILVTNNEGYPGAPTTARMLAEGGTARRARGRHPPGRAGRAGAHRGTRRLGQHSGRGRARRRDDGRHHAAHRLGRRREGLPAPGLRRARGDGAAAARVPGRGGRGAFRSRDRRRDHRQLLPHAREAWRSGSPGGAGRGARAPARKRADRACEPQIAGGSGWDHRFLARATGRRDRSGSSTSGWEWKHPGRLGDTPIIGAGSMPIRATAPAPAPAWARWRSAAAPRAPWCST